MYVRRQIAADTGSVWEVRGVVRTVLSALLNGYGHYSALLKCGQAGIQAETVVFCFQEKLDIWNFMWMLLIFKCQPIFKNLKPSEGWTQYSCGRSLASRLAAYDLWISRRKINVIYLHTDTHAPFSSLWQHVVMSTSKAQRVMGMEWK